MGVEAQVVVIHGSRFVFSACNSPCAMALRMNNVGLAMSYELRTMNGLMEAVP